MKPPKSDRDTRIDALHRLAVATREKTEPETFVVYLENTACFATGVLVTACRRLETSAQWFPKVAELVAECRLVAADQQRRADLARPALNPPPDPSPERMRELMAKIKAACQGQGVKRVGSIADAVGGRK